MRKTKTEWKNKSLIESTITYKKERDISKICISTPIQNGYWNSD